MLCNIINWILIMQKQLFSLKNLKKHCEENERMKEEKNH